MVRLWSEESAGFGGKGASKECVEVAFLGDAVGVRDSKRPAEPALVFAAVQWDVFVTAVGAGRFDSAESGSVG
ncbi:DUF397 domain-containing protein [Nocardia sp. NPDC058058]|uniref:DUF397 domain-containing protein n=1 Tax=Nocardia sp. NPDC058058 TaxID=3346317 RepID=UPI0036DD4489